MFPSYHVLLLVLLVVSCRWLVVYNLLGPAVIVYLPNASFLLPWAVLSICHWNYEEGTVAVLKEKTGQQLNSYLQV
jgi:hypothetical protein